MPVPAPTELLAEDIRDLRESTHRIATRVDGLEGAVRDLGRDVANFRADVTQELGNFRAEVTREVGNLRTDVNREVGSLRADVTRELGSINTNLESLRVRFEDSISVAKWTVGILAPMVIAVVSGGFWLTWHAAKLDSRVQEIENRQEKARLTPTIPRAE